MFMFMFAASACGQDNNLQTSTDNGVSNSEVQTSNESAEPSVICEGNYVIDVRIGNGEEKIVIFYKEIPYRYGIFESLDGHQNWIGGYLEVEEINTSIQEANASISAANQGIKKLYGYGDDLPKPQFPEIPLLKSINEEPLTRGVQSCNGINIENGSSFWQAEDKKGYSINHRMVNGRMWIIFSQGKSMAEYSYPLSFLSTAVAGGQLPWEIISPTFVESQEERNTSDGEYSDTFMSFNNFGTQIGRYKLFSTDSTLRGDHETLMVLSSVLNWGVYMQASEYQVPVALTINTRYSSTEWETGSLIYDKEGIAQYHRTMFYAVGSSAQTEHAEANYSSGTSEFSEGTVYLQILSATGR